MDRRSNIYDTAAYVSMLLTLIIDQLIGPPVEQAIALTTIPLINFAGNSLQ